MTRLIAPPLAEVIRADTTSTETAVASLLAFYEGPDGGFNYLRAVKVTKAAYRGMHKLKVLLQAPPSEQNRVGFRFNQEVIELTAPYAFGRTTQVFDLSARKFPFGAGRFASYRVPFFFVEKGVVKVCYLQTRKGPYLTAEDYGGMAAVHSRYLMAQEFYGEKIDVEYVDVGATIEGGPRERRRLTLANLDIWPADRLADHLNVVAEALVAIEARGVAPKRRRPLKDAELPLFD